MALRYTVTVSNRTAIRQGWRVSCFAMSDDWNALTRRICESFHRTEASARKRTAELPKAHNAELLD